MIRSLYSKLALTTIGILVASSIIAFYISNTYYHQVLKLENDAKNTRIALEIAEYLHHHKEIDLHAYFSHIAGLGYQLYIIDENGEAHTFGQSFRKEELRSETISSVFQNQIYHGMRDFPRETFVTGFFANELSNTIGVPFIHNQQSYALFLRPDINLLFKELRLLFALLIGLTIAITILLVIIITRFLIKPITTLKEGTEAIAAGNFDVSLDIDRQDELGELALSFNKMSEQLKQLEEMRNQFMNNVSHDIQSPLSNIKGYTNLLKLENLSDKSNQYLTIITEESDRLSHLTKQLLLFSSLKNSADILKKRRFSLSDQLKKNIRNYQWLLHDKELMLSYSIPDVEIIGDESLLFEVWDNLLSNAIKYNRTEGSIDIKLQEREAAVEVIFDDTGIGLTSMEKERIFERFYRAEPSRTRSVDGTGLGLTISQMIVELHQGVIDIKSSKSKGTSVTVFLPKI